MQKTEFVAFRATPEQRQKLEALASATKTNLSWVLGALVDRAELVTPALFVGAVPGHYAATVVYDDARRMWRVAVYRDGDWIRTEWFHTEMAATYYAERVRLGQVTPDGPREVRA